MIRLLARIAYALAGYALVRKIGRRRVTIHPLTVEVAVDLTGFKREMRELERVVRKLDERKHSVSIG